MPGDDLRSSRAMLRRIEDAERLKAVEVNTSHLTHSVARLERAMEEHTRSSEQRQDTVMTAIRQLGDDIDAKLDKIHTRHNVLARRFYWFAGLASTGAASAAKWGGALIDAIFHGGPPGAK